MKKIISVTLLAAAAAICSLALAVDEKSAAKSDHVMFAAADLKWGDAPPSLPAGAQIAVLEGDPGKAGPFTIRLKTPAGFKIPAHTHPTAEGITVISGSFSMGTGPKLDEAAGHEMSAGAFALMPAGTQHFAYSKSECIIQVHSIGPFQINYVNPADDPRNTKK
jgi:quercetin dioxygenase-like cupin family protein